MSRQIPFITRFGIISNDYGSAVFLEPQDLEQFASEVGRVTGDLNSAIGELKRDVTSSSETIKSSQSKISELEQSLLQLNSTLRKTATKEDLESKFNEVEQLIKPTLQAIHSLHDAAFGTSAPWRKTFEESVNGQIDRIRHVWDEKHAIATRTLFETDVRLAKIGQEQEVIKQLHRQHEDSINKQLREFHQHLEKSLAFLISEAQAAIPVLEKLRGENERQNRLIHELSLAASEITWNP